MDEPQTPQEEEDMLKFSYRKAVVALMLAATITRQDIACAVRAMTRFWKPWPGTFLKYGDVGHTLPASDERVGDHVR